MKIEKIENEEFKDGVRSQKRIGRCEGEVTDALMNMEIGDCLKLTLEVMAFSLESFFPGSGSTSSPGDATSSRQSR